MVISHGLRGGGKCKLQRYLMLLANSENPRFQLGKTIGLQRVCRSLGIWPTTAYLP